MQINKIEFQALITYYMTKQGLKGLNELSEFTLISYKTLLKYWKDPEKFPLGEVGRILDTLRIPIEEFTEKVILKKNGRHQSIYALQQSRQQPSQQEQSQRQQPGQSGQHQTRRITPT